MDMVFAVLMMVMAVANCMPMSSFFPNAIELLARHHLGFVGAFLVALMGDAGIPGQHGQERGGDGAWGEFPACRAVDIGSRFAHRSPVPERSALVALIVVKGHDKYLTS